MPVLGFPAGNAGGLATPDIRITHLSRIKGPICGRYDEAPGPEPAPAGGAMLPAAATVDVACAFEAGKFDPKQFFPLDKLLNAKTSARSRSPTSSPSSGMRWART